MILYTKNKLSNLKSHVFRWVPKGLKDSLHLFSFLLLAYQLWRKWFKWSDSVQGSAFRGSDRDFPCLTKNVNNSKITPRTTDPNTKFGVII